MNDGKYSEAIENKFNIQIIDENNVKNLIINFTKIYNNNDLRHFSVDFRNNFIKINNLFNNQLNFLRNTKKKRIITP